MKKNISLTALLIFAVMLSLMGCGYIDVPESNNTHECTIDSAVSNMSTEGEMICCDEIAELISAIKAEVF